MKRLSLVLLVLFLISKSISLAQTAEAEEMVSVPKSQLTEQQKLAVQAQSVTDKLQTVSKFTGMGKEVGEAVNSSLSAITHQADTLANTKVGKFTMFMIAYKIMGEEVIQFVVGTSLMLIVIIMSVLYYVQNIRTRIFVQSKKAVEGGRFDYNYGTVSSNSESRFWWFAFSIISIIICLMVIFV